MDTTRERERLRQYFQDVIVNANASTAFRELAASLRQSLAEGVVGAEYHSLAVALERMAATAYEQKL